MMGQTNYPGMGYASNGVYVVMAAPQGSSMILGGSVVASREVTLTAQLPGRVEFLAGREGDWFDKQQLIIGLSDDALDAEEQNQDPRDGKRTDDRVTHHDDASQNAHNPHEELPAPGGMVYEHPDEGEDARY